MAPRFIDVGQFRSQSAEGDGSLWWLGEHSTYARNAGARNAYDANTNIYNAKPSNLLHYRSKLATALQGTGLVRVFFSPGDSTYGGTTTGAGVRGTADIVTSLQNLVAKSYSLPNPGTGIVPCTGAPVDSRWTLQAGWAAQDSNTYAKGTTAAATITFTPTSGQVGTVVNVWYFNNSVSFTVNIDGSGAVTVNPAGGSTLAKYTVSGLTNATHTVVITAGGSASSGTPCFIAACEVGPANGVTISNFGASGTVTGDWAGQEGFPHKFFTPLQIGCDLVFCGLMINDWNTAVSLSTFRNNYATILNDWVTNTSAPSIVLTVSANPNNGTNNAVLPWGSFVTAVYQLADQYDVPLIDFTDRFGDNWTNANTLGLMSGGTSPFHPSANGYQDQALAVRALVAP